MTQKKHSHLCHMWTSASQKANSPSNRVFEILDVNMMTVSSTSTESHSNNILMSITSRHQYHKNELSLKGCFDAFTVESDDDVININLNDTKTSFLFLSCVDVSITKNQLYLKSCF